MPPGIPPPEPPLGDLAVMMSSTRRIIAADSAADLMACSLTTIGSLTPFSMLSLRSSLAISNACLIDSDVNRYAYKHVCV